jgi:hypothetical protein
LKLRIEHKKYGYKSASLGPSLAELSFERQAAFVHVEPGLTGLQSTVNFTGICPPKPKSMTTNALFFAWNRPIPGREKLSGAHFQEFVQYLAGLQQKGAIKSFDTVILDVHGGNLNGFFLLRADAIKLDALVATEEWQNHITRASFHLEGAGVVRGATGDAVNDRMSLWFKNIPT